MIIVLKVIMTILIVVDAIVFRVLLKDWRESRKAINYDTSSPMERIVINTIAWFVFSALLIFSVFLLYFITSTIEVTPLWE